VTDATCDVLGSTAQGQLRTIVERIERLEEDKAAIAGDLKEVFAEAKGNGFDVKILRKVVRIRKQDRAKRQEEEALTDLYLSALGELPLFEGRPARADANSGGALDGTRITLAFPGRDPIETDGQQLAEALATLKDGDLYEQARELVLRDGKPSTSYVQRRLGLGYNRAAALMEQLERDGVVGPPNHAGKREVLLGQAARA
jgi:uncharacterized protein (UPF0335 family)